MGRLLKDSQQENLGKQVRELAYRFRNIRELEIPLLSVTETLNAPAPNSVFFLVTPA